MVPTTCSCCSSRSTSPRFRGMMLALCIAGADGVQVRGGKSSGSFHEEGKRVKPNHLDRSFSREDSYCTISRRCTLSRRGKEQVAVGWLDTIPSEHREPRSCARFVCLGWLDTIPSDTEEPLIRPHASSSWWVEATVVAILFARGLTRVVQTHIAARATSSCRAQIKGLGVSVPSSA